MWEEKFKMNNESTNIYSPFMNEDDKRTFFSQDEFETNDEPKTDGSIVLKNPGNLKHGELNAVKELWDYLLSTYSQHYVGDKLQIIDLTIEKDDEIIPFARWSAINYLYRFGEKEGYNRKDLFKAIHYIIFLLYATKKENN